MGRYRYNAGYRKKRAYRLWALVPFMVVGTFIAARIATSTELQPAESKNNASAAIPVHVESGSEIDQELSWPTYGYAAFAKPDKVVVPTLQEEPVPIASLAKMITALAILEKSPLKPGEQGPTLTLTESDVKIFNKYLAKDGSVVPIEVGQNLTQYQVLQAMILPSANNISDSAAIWLFGSLDNYTVYANDMLDRYGLTNSHVADASGFSPLTVSTGEEVAKLGLLFTEQPVLMEIAQQPSVTLPVAGEIPNYNSSLNDADFIGLKVGYTDEAGRTYVAAKIDEDTNEVTVAAILGADNFVTLKNDMQVLLGANTPDE